MTRALFFLCLHCFGSDLHKADPVCEGGNRKAAGELYRRFLEREKDTGFADLLGIDRA